MIAMVSLGEGGEEGRKGGREEGEGNLRARDDLGVLKDRGRVLVVDGLRGCQDQLHVSAHQWKTRK